MPSKTASWEKSTTPGVPQRLTSLKAAFLCSFLKFGLQKARGRVIFLLTPSKATHLLEAANTIPAAKQEDKQISSAPEDVMIPTAWLLFQIICICPPESKEHLAELAWIGWT